MNILSFDVESNGLHGQAFAVGAVVYSVERNEVLAELLLRCPIDGAVDEWVAENVIPQLDGVKETHATAAAMRTAFWHWYRAALEEFDDVIVMADIGYPVEARFLTACQDDDSSRAWQGPYPLHELASLLLAADVDPDIDRIQWAGYDPAELRKHNPLDDALVSAKCAAICFARLA